MSSFTDSEKVQYALKHALNVTMQHKSLSAYAEERAPKRIFPSNIMSKDIISKGEGDLDANGNYLQGHVFNPSGTLTVTANISTPVTTVQYYKIVDPITNVVSNVTVNDILSNPDITGMSYDSIAALSDSSVDSNDPWYDKAVKIQQLQKAWFFRGHYGGAASEGDMFSHATSNYNGLYLAYNKIAAGTVVNVTDATKVVPHIKLYLQVQTENIASGSDGTGDVDNMSFRHSLLENMLGLESGFANVVPVQGPHYTSSSSEKMPIIQTGIMGNEWFSQDTYGMLSFYALGSGSHTVADNYPDPSTAHGTSAPLVSYLRYVGETAATTGLGGGSGGGGGGGGGTVSTVGLGGTFMGDQLVPVDASGLEIMLNATTGTAIGDGEFNVYTDIDLRGGSTLLLNGTPAVFSNWVEDASNNISRNSDVTVTGDLQLNGTLKDASGNARIFSNWTIDGNDLTRDSNVTVTGDLQLNGTLKDASGNDRIFSNWGISGENIYRESNVGIGMNNPLHALDISGDLNVLGNVTINSLNATESFNYLAPINQLQEVDEEPSWTGNVSTSIGFDELVDANIPESLDTLKEIAELVKDISNSNALTVGLGLKANKASPIFTGNVGIGQVANVNYALDISGDVNISSGALKLNGQTPVYSNWEVSNSDIFRNSNVTIGQGSVNTNYKLYVNGTSYITGTLQVANTITAPTFSGALSGNATTATTATNANKVKIQSTYTNASNLYPMLQTAISGTNDCWTQSNGTFYYRANTNRLYCTHFQGALTGNASTASQVFVTHGTTTNSDHRINFTNSTGNGNAYIFGDSDFVFNPGTNILSLASGSVSACAIFGKIRVGSWNYGSYDYMSIQHKSLDWSSATGNYALRQHANGTTDINCATGKSIGFLVNNDYKMIMNSSGQFGIGTTNPANKLEIHGGPLGLKNGNHTATTTQQILFGFGGVANLEYAHSIRTRHNGQSSANDTQNSIDFYLWKKGDTTTTIGEKHGMSITAAGVGIGTDTPSAKLEVNGSALFTSDATWQTSVVNANSSNNNQWQWLVGGSSNNSGIADAMSFYYAGDQAGSTAGTHKIIIKNNGRVGIGTTTPGATLSIVGQNTTSFNGYRYTSTGVAAANATSTLALYTNGDAGIYGVLRVGSDRRIKQNIDDVPDNLALGMVRNIPCRYYEYIDKVSKGDSKTIGFIAQEVKEHFPMAVTIHNDILPNEMRELENISWEELIDGSNNTYKLISDLSDCSGIKYRFYVSNDPSGNDEGMKEVVGNPDNTFTFQKSWNYVFCYGREVDDFHMLDKNKLFALNFSATQELDRKVIALEAENQTIKQENEDLKFQMALLRSELTTIKAHLGI